MKIGFVTMPLSGHLNPMTALARRRQSRDNEVVFFGIPDVEPFVRAAGLDFVPYGEAEFPIGSIATKSIALWQRCAALRWCGIRAWI
jgi:zeaxanthin glucosyltransferase